MSRILRATKLFSCLRCAISFERPRSYTAKYCSRECSSMASRGMGHKAAAKRPVKCQVCGSMFLGYVSQTKCGQECPGQSKLASKVMRYLLADWPIDMVGRHLEVSTAYVRKLARDNSLANLNHAPRLGDDIRSIHSRARAR